MKKFKLNMKYIIIWILPFVILCISGYNLLKSAFIYFMGIELEERLEGLAYLTVGILYMVAFIVTSIIAIAVTVYVYRKDRVTP